ncbi:hypothetical protein [Pandoraea apista]|uniref:hypothetical protein n=1 Tax=Pandoraea apista TaxID=93218 RepID=UPI0006579FFB|nr:hypothetical protein [Pandoraea apista]ALS63590.1 hypothetical protein AT395_00020 [Pandoraea apista]CFB63116.1 hypothetical protein LMG16407_03191 [Pandoraea apista]
MCKGTFVHIDTAIARRRDFAVAECAGVAWIGIIFEKQIKLARPVQKRDVSYFVPGNAAKARS